MCVANAEAANASTSILKPLQLAFFGLNFGSVIFIRDDQVLQPLSTRISCQFSTPSYQSCRKNSVFLWLGEVEVQIYES